MNVFKRSIFVSLVIFLFTLTSWTTVFCKEIKIGVIGPMKFVQGQSHWNGAIMAADEINAKGGIKLGDKMMKIKLIQADSNEFLNITDATNAMERLMTKDKVDFVVGGFRTEAVLAMQDIAMEHKKIFIGCGASTDELCTRVATNYKTYKYWFRETPFNTTYLAKTAFINLATVAAVVKKATNAPVIKVAIVAEKAQWAEGMVKAAENIIPKMGMEVAGIWRPSPNATDVSAELAAIQRSGVNVIFTVFSASVGITFARQAGELKIPAMQVGINVEAQKEGFWKATREMGNYIVNSNTYARGVESNENTTAFVEGYIKRFGETPAYTADTYSAIVYTIKPAIENTGTLDADKLVTFLEGYVRKNATSTLKYAKDAKGRQTHDVTWGPEYATGIYTQWQDGRLVGIWPNKWKATPEAPEVTYKGMGDIKVPPWMLKKDAVKPASKKNK